MSKFKKNVAVIVANFKVIAAFHFKTKVLSHALIVSKYVLAQ